MRLKRTVATLNIKVDESWLKEYSVRQHKPFFCSLCVAVVVHLQTHTHSQNLYIMSQPLLYGEYFIHCHSFRNRIQKSGQIANPGLNVKVLTKGTTTLFDCSLNHHFPSYALKALATVFQDILRCFHCATQTVCTVHSLS